MVAPKTLRQRGFKVYTEYGVGTPGGYKNQRFADIWVKNPKGKQYLIQVGVKNKNGTMVSREVKAYQDINNRPEWKGKIRFVSHN
jgi:hypothetical protein